MIFSIFYQKGGIDWEIMSGSLPVTVAILTINIFLFEKIRNNKLQPIHLRIESFLSVCRILLVCSTFFIIGVALAFFASPVSIVIWKTVVDQFSEGGKLVQPGYYFLICFVLLILECTYYFMIKELNNRLFPQKNGGK